MNEQLDLRSVSQRLLALSKKNKYALQINNFAQAQAFASDLLGITDASGISDSCFESEVDLLVENARASGYLVLRDYDESTQKLAYLELVAPGAHRACRKIEPIHPNELDSVLSMNSSVSCSELMPSEHVYRNSRLALGSFRTRNSLKMRDTAYGDFKRVMISLGDAGTGHLQRAQFIASQAARAGWGIVAYDFMPDKDDFFVPFKRTIDAARRNSDLLCQSHPGFHSDGVALGSLQMIGGFGGSFSCHDLIFNNDPSMLPMANLLTILSEYCHQAYPHIAGHIGWLNNFATLDHVLALLSEPKATFYAPGVKESICEMFSITDATSLSFEQSEIYHTNWKRWVRPFLDIAEKICDLASTCNVGFNETFKARRILYSPVMIESSGGGDLFNRLHVNAISRSLGEVQPAKELALVILRVSGHQMTNPIVMAMTRAFITKGYQLLLVVDGQTQKAALISQKLAAAGRADCLWHTCHIKDTPSMPYGVSKATGGQCIFVNRERLKEPLNLLPIQ